MLPRSWARALGCQAGRAVFWLLPRERMKTLENLRSVFGNEAVVVDGSPICRAAVADGAEKTGDEIAKIAERVFVNLAKTGVDVLRFPTMNREMMTRLVTLENGTGNLEEVLAQGKGAIALTGHIGNWELLGSYFRHLGFPGSIVARRIYYEPFNRVLVRLRQSGLVKTIYHDGSPRALLAELHANRVLGMSADQDIDHLNGIFIPFFGRPAWTPTAPAKIALTSGAAIVPVFLIHSGEGYRLFVEEPIWPLRSDSKDEAIDKMTRAWSGVVERFVRKFPDQWVWMHHRWRTSPETVMALEKERRNLIHG